MHLGQLALAPTDESSIAAVVEAAAAFPFMGNMPVAVTPETLHDAILSADALGRVVFEQLGDLPYKRLHG